MIRIIRPAVIPKKLKNDGPGLTKANNKAFHDDAAKFLKDLKIKTAVYGAKSVKKALKKAQHNKCCFCEKEQVDEYGAVEHFRPKKGYKIDRKQKKMTKPGYFWLAYDWSNLFFVCGRCNTSFKGNLFPLKDDLKRAKSHKDNVADEVPLLLDPTGSGVMDPESHIYFKDQFVMYHSEFGQATIDICGLDRDELNNKRAKLIKDIEARIWILSAQDSHTPLQVQSAKNYLRNCQTESAEFSSVAKNYLSQFNIVTT
ncbi:hypothetical protein D0C36_00825 [Mucilaginibacter conchicola]|uniref:TIGR02646 family protein n=1 Tax=Mucilaginibacter conchicola TaxID=2303333 RepID=A0A372NVE8_9SPHI|nr:hypothetical protein [Mucilaginibacter conchicola]RFZ94133.1 hypothetical protein D0C36_00825 [Mucilaginibacter conchicola]